RRRSHTTTTTATTLSISATIGSTRNSIATSTKLTGAHMSKASTATGSTVRITGLCGICMANSMRIIPEPGTTTTRGAATRTAADMGTSTGMGTNRIPQRYYYGYGN